MTDIHKNECLYVSRMLANCMGYHQSPLDTYGSRTYHPEVMYFWQTAWKLLTENPAFSTLIKFRYSDDFYAYALQISKKEFTKTPFQVELIHS